MKAKRFGVVRLGVMSLVVAVGTMLAACGSVGVNSGGPTEGTATSGTPSIIIQNNSNQNICKVRFSPSTDNSWGPDRLGASEQITPGTTRGWELPAGQYDIRLETCDEQPLAEQRNFTVAGPTPFVFQ